MPEDRTALFELLGDSERRPEFFEHVAEDVIWTVMGTHPLAGTYTSREQFLSATIERLDGLIEGGIALEVRAVHDAGDHVIAELIMDGKANDGRPFYNTYCWVCRFAGEKIVEVRAYLDSALIVETFQRLGA